MLWASLQHRPTVERLACYRPKVAAILMAMKKFVGICLLCFLSALTILYFYSGELDPRFRDRGSLDVIAHRGLSQTFSQDGLTNETCTASRIFEPRHSFLENTLDSIEAAFALGATIVEIDIRPSRDGVLMVFHDNTLSCRTEAEGMVWDYTAAELQALDIGYGYTADSGKTYPFRGKGVGLMPTLNQVLEHFPTGRFLIDNKNGNNMDVVDALVAVLSRLPATRRNDIYLWSSEAAFLAVNREVPEVTRLLQPKSDQKRYWKSYVLSLGFRPDMPDGHSPGLGIPHEHTRYLWGWPNRVMNTVYRQGGRFYVVAQTEEHWNEVSTLPIDGIVTDNLDLLAPLL